jgi:general secretion pathway protein I
VHSRQGREAGFTIIETLVALAVVTAVLAGIGTLIATSARGTSALERHVELTETARAIASALPGSGKLVGDISGELAGHRWRVDVLPFAADDVNPELSSPWVPQTVVITVRSPTGGGLLHFLMSRPPSCGIQVTFSNLP